MTDNPTWPPEDHWFEAGVFYNIADADAAHEAAVSELKQQITELREQLDCANQAIEAAHMRGRSTVINWLEDYAMQNFDAGMQEALEHARKSLLAESNAERDISGARTSATGVDDHE